MVSVPGTELREKSGSCVPLRPMPNALRKAPSVGFHSPAQIVSGKSQSGLSKRTFQVKAEEKL